ncbi:interferon-induced protein with tetratricopeptide repeats 9 [Denticeps clupeoides]|uniref:Interferon-induced protein with tetratricopeptide repeats 5 n=1 Tax=Denticeps clupeoides TaxID=299321 RepID=A0AAY4DF80_9TELE|nr:interferon-induced protein with tetratricopeptide repeats 5-like [Denticeps clupeoides]
MNSDLKVLECPFTWGVEKTLIKDLDNICIRLLERIEHIPLSNKATYFNVLAFVTHLEGKNELALEYLHKAEDVLKDGQHDEADFIVTYSSFAWMHDHLGNQEDMALYLGKVKNIGQDAEVTVLGEKGWTFLRLGVNYYERAKESFQKAVELKPESLSYNMGYGVVLYRIEELVRRDKIHPESSAAVKQLKKTLSLDPNLPEIMVLLALKLEGFEQEESRALIEKALAQSPDVPQITRYAAKYFRAVGSIKESLEVLSKALDQAPNSSFLHHQVGLCYKQEYIRLSQSGRSNSDAVANCIRSLSKAVELKPSNTHAWVNMAEALSEDHQLDKAENIFTRLVRDKTLMEAEKQHCRTHYGLFLLYKRKDADGAVMQLKEAYKIKVPTYDRDKAGQKLRQLAGRRGCRNSREILAFLDAEDEKSKNGDDLAKEFSKKMNL